MCVLKPAAASLGIALALAACSGPANQVVPQVASTISASVIPARQLALIQSGCQAAQPLLDRASSSTKLPASVSGAAIYPAAYCRDLASAPVGQVPATTDGNTFSWLNLGIAAVKAAVALAPLLL